MKIDEARLDEICYMWKNNQIRLERNDVWGDPNKNSESVLKYCEKFSEDGGNGIARIVYLYGQGGMGKSFACGEIAERLKKSPYSDNFYVAVVDLQRQKNFEDDLKCLADEIANQLGKHDMFPRFNMAYYSYKMKKGEEVQQEERSTKWEKLNSNDSFKLVSGVAGLLTPLGTVSDVVDLASEGYKWFLRMRDNVQYKALAHQLEEMQLKEIRSRLVRYFAADFRDGMEKKKRKKKFVILLDTVESMRYQALRRGDDEDYLEWLTEKEGLFRLLPDCLWLLFGREEIPWKNYDREEWEDSFTVREFTRPEETAVREYLLRKLGQREPGEFYREDEKLYAIIEEIIRQTERYSLAIENCVDVYFRIWNRNLKDNKIRDQIKADSYRPSLDQIKDMLLGNREKKVISARFLQYYTLQEREVLYTLVCLEKWTDEILENFIWKGMINNILIYEEMCATSFIHTDGNGVNSIQGLMLSSIMEECSLKLKKRLLSGILLEMAGMEINASYRLLLASAIHIAKYYACGQREFGRLGEQFIRVAGYLTGHADFQELSEICEGILGIKDEGDTDEDLCNAARIGKYFAEVFCKKDAAEELCMLRGCRQFGGYSLRMWKILWKVARSAGAYAEAYEVVDLLEERLSGLPANDEYYLLLRQKVELMQSLGDRFGSIQIEEEIRHVCNLAFELAPEKPRLAEKLNMRLWAEYYFYARPDLRGEVASKKIGECIEKYRACCTEAEIRENVDLCVLEVMRERVKGTFALDATNEWALKGLQILERQYEEQSVEQPDMDILFHAVVTGVPMTEEQQELYRWVFEVYYKRFYKGCSWQTFPMLLFACRGRKFVVCDDYDEDGISKVELSDLVEQGILYLSNLSGSNPQRQLQLLLCFYLRSELKNTLMKEAEEIRFSVQRLLLNNQVLLYFLQKTLEKICSEQETADRRKICVLLQAVFTDDFFAAPCFDAEEKRQLLSLLQMCGLETDRAEWKAEYTGCAAGEEFEILNAIRGWKWEIDFQTDVRMAATLLSLAWYLKERSTEERLLDLLEKQFRDARKRECFWSALMQEARSEGGEWGQHIEILSREILEIEEIGKPAKRPDAGRFELDGEKELSAGEQYEEKLRELLAAEDYGTMRSMIKEVLDGYKPGKSDDRLAVAHFYVPVVKNRGLDGFMEGIRQLQEQRPILVGGEYFVLRAYAYLDDRAGFAAYYRENSPKIWERLENVFTLSLYPAGELHHMAGYVFSLEDKELAEDYCRRLANLCASNRGIVGYAEGILYQLQWFTEYVPFETIWRKEHCIKKEITYSNYEEIYGLIERYLTSEELMDVFTAWSFQKHSRPKKAELCFWESEFHVWMREKFGEAYLDWVSAEFPELCDAWREYETYYRDGYLHLVNTRLCGIKDLRDALLKCNSEGEHSYKNQGGAM